MLLLLNILLMSVMIKVEVKSAQPTYAPSLAYACLFSSKYAQNGLTCLLENFVYVFDSKALRQEISMKF